MIGGFTQRVCATLLVLNLPASVLAQSNASSPDPESAGFSAKRLGRIAPWYQAQVDAGALPGAVVAIARNGQARLSPSDRHL
jgi:CubicO group peptidase (beta-lactamase class C family)